MASNFTRWSEFVELTALKQDWDILRLDLRGHAESQTRGRLNFRRWCNDLLEILQAENSERALLVGHSLGAQIAMQFAAHHPERTLGLAVIDPIFPQALIRRMRTFKRFRYLLWVVLAPIMLANAIGIHRRHIPRRDLRVLDENTRKNFLDVGKLEEMVQNYGSPWPDLRHFPTANYLQELQATVQPLPPLQQIQAPLLALLAESPTYTDPLLTQKLIEQLPNAEIAKIDAFHWPLTEKPHQTREAIELWCTQHFMETPLAK